MKFWILFLVCGIVPAIEGHGRLLTPPSRSTAWRVGFDTPPNYNDNELNCGGFNNQWSAPNDGRCGLCGDPFQGPRENEAGGLYATGTVVGEYPEGAVVDVTVQITANHEGYHQFRLCEHNDPASNITQACLDKNLLADAVTGETDHYMGTIGNMDYTYRLQLPAGVSCTHCVLQWKYNAGNSWGVDSETGEECIGCGPQEQFYGCADIAVGGGGGGGGSATTTTARPPTTTTAAADTTTTSGGGATTTTQRPATTTTRKPTTTVAASEGVECVPTELYEHDPNMAEWCTVNCAAGYCPSTHCVCANKVVMKCKPVSPWDTVAGIADWCQKNCQTWQPLCRGMCSCV